MAHEHLETGGVYVWRLVHDYGQVAGGTGRVAGAAVLTGGTYPHGAYREAHPAPPLGDRVPHTRYTRHVTRRVVVVAVAGTRVLVGLRAPRGGDAGTRGGDGTP